MLNSSDSALAEQRRAILAAEINSYPVIIDRACFRKSEEGRKAIKVEKAAFKAACPPNYKPKTITKTDC